MLPLLGTTLVRIALGLLGCLVCSRGEGFYVLPEIEQVPLDRLIANLEARLEKSPDAVETVVNLARTHAMAYSLKTETAQIHKGRPERGWLREFDTSLVPFNQPVNDPAKRESARRHLERALSLYRRAVALAPDELVARLGYAWLTERSGDTRRAVALYREIIAEDWARELARGRREPGIAPPPGSQESAVVYVVTPARESVIPEAAGYLIPLLDAERDAAEIAQLQRRSAVAGNDRPVTPIAVPLRAGLQAADLEDRSAAVAFDADGSGQQKHWTWITPDAAWLVYQRQPASAITSALQLFGNATFWLFWQNGYQALQALDDDADGALQEGELTGLGLWHDGNGNGLSEPGEVMPLAAFDIVTLRYRYATDLQHPDRIAVAPQGVTFRDGTTRATYDLLLHPQQTPIGSAASDEASAAWHR